MKLLTGDLIQLADWGLFDAIIHGCNCCHCMGGGIAGQIANKWPSVKAADDACDAKLGGFSVAEVQTKIGFPLRVYNLYTQPIPGPAFDITALLPALKAMRRDLRNHGLRNCRVAFPMIGCGIGGGNWSRVYPILAQYLEQSFKPVYVEYGVSM